METTKQINDDFNLKSVEEYLVEMVAERDGVFITPKQAKRILTKRFQQIAKNCVKGQATKINNIILRVARDPSVDVPWNERKNYVMPNYSSAYLYTLRIVFKEEFKGYFTLQPKRSVLTMIKNEINRDADARIRLINNVNEIV